MDNVVRIDEKNCIGCGKCVKLCPKGILYLDEHSKICKVTDHKACDRLAGCERVCPTKAITIADGVAL